MIELPGGRELGVDVPCFIAAEVGINHNGDLDLAHRLIDAAAAAGADGVKFQNYRTEDFVSDRELTYEYVSQGKRIVEAQYDLFKRCELRGDSLGELRRHCDEAGVVFFSTPTSPAGIDELVAAGCRLLKNGSDYMQNTDLIAAMARSGLPTILSTGMAELQEIGVSVDAFREAGGTELVLLHCTSAYPTPLDEAELRAIPLLAETYGCPVGFSDHTEGTLAAVAAVAVGAVMIEKHFTLDRDLPGPDHRFSSNPAELADLVRQVRAAEVALGTGVVGPTPSEEAGRRDFRLSCVAARNLNAGHRLERADVAFRRPGTGLAPQERDRLVGRELMHGLPRGHVFSDSDFR